MSQQPHYRFPRYFGAYVFVTLPMVLGLLVRSLELVHLPSHDLTTFGTSTLLNEEISYFANKSNLWNQIFVKNAWFWTSLAYLCLISLLSSRSSPKVYASTLLRYFLATAYFILFAQWFFGPSIMDRIFVWSGGVCLFKTDANIEAITSYSKCRRMGGKWLHGHDISGHLFLLCHASGFLMAELTFIWRLLLETPSEEPTLIQSLLVRLNLAKVDTTTSRMVVLTGVIGLIGLWWWMMLMTTVYFHHWPEKISGWLLGNMFNFICYRWVYPYLF